ncbi:MAG: hypothetical protein GY926_08750 [bacterium]|nr:hypothetical protein [bacterium]
MEAELALPGIVGHELVGQKGVGPVDTIALQDRQIELGVAALDAINNAGCTLKADDGSQHHPPEFGPEAEALSGLFAGLARVFFEFLDLWHPWDAPNGTETSEHGTRPFLCLIINLRVRGSTASD